LWDGPSKNYPYFRRDPSGSQMPMGEDHGYV
jgi:hypothetical protein